FQLCGGAHLDKECPLNKEVKSVEEVKYGEFGRSSPFNNGTKYRVGPPRYYTRVDNRPPFREKRPSLEELMNKHLEESTRKRAKLTKEFHAKAASEVPNSSVGQCKAVYANDEAPIDNASSNTGKFYSSLHYWKFKFYAMADLGASVNVIPKSMFEHLKLVNLKKTDMLVEMADMTKRAPIGIKEISLGIGDDRVTFDMDKKIHNFMTHVGKVYMVNSIHNDEPSTGSNARTDKYEINQGCGLIWDNRYAEWCSENSIPEIDQLADEYELGIGKKGHMLEDIWEYCEKVQGDNTNWWHDHGFEEDERQESGLDIEEYDPPKVHVKTFEVKRYSFDNGHSFIYVTKEIEDSLPLGRENGSRFIEMIQKELDTGGKVLTARNGIRSHIGSYSCRKNVVVLA
ncbi:hypothetical protein Tco_1268363, partial [Tanacetum coccineum]